MSGYNGWEFTHNHGSSMYGEGNINSSEFEPELLKRLHPPLETRLRQGNSTGHEAYAIWASTELVTKYHAPSPNLR